MRWAKASRRFSTEDTDPGLNFSRNLENKAFSPPCRSHVSISKVKRLENILMFLSAAMGFPLLRSSSGDFSKWRDKISVNVENFKGLSVEVAT